MWLLYVGAFSNSPTSNCPPAPSSAISHYHTYLKYVYGNSPISPDTKWPPSPGREYISLAVVGIEGRRCRDEYIGHTLQGNIKQVLHSRKDISVEQILEPVKGQNKPRLVLMEGAPGIGKSMLAWELCRKWEELSCMQQYSLVVLLRLREEKVQRISEVSYLFISYESKHKKSLVEEVSENQGSGVLFILDGFDELPKTLQKEGFLLDLIRGNVLPASTVLITSRPSATAELLTSCSPKHIEILGFTQESVKAYASSIFSGEQEKLEKFMDSISASENPAINSLMYVPLNAAIIVRMYLNCKSDTLLPHTLTELYTLLCLTILNRDLKVHVDKFEDLPADLYEQFLHLSQIAFEGILNEEVIFHTLPPGLVHFGFLDAVSALYGGWRISYNFLHLTLQEFFAAYHISHLGSSGLEVFKQHGKDKRWNVVWRFVAGLTKFEHYKGHMDSDLFIKSREDSKNEISRFTIQCLFEAQSMDLFSSIFGTSSPDTSTKVCALYCTALDTYTLGFCISKFHVANWCVDMNHHLTPFIKGLNMVTPSADANIRSLCISAFPDNYTEFKEHLVHHVTSFDLNYVSSTSENMICFSELIPHMTSLDDLILDHVNITDEECPNCLLNILRQLSQSSVTKLNIIATNFNYSSDWYSALEPLVCPSTGKLETLAIGDDFFHFNNRRLAGLVSAPSSLQSLELVDIDLAEHVPYLMNNTCLTHLILDYSYYWFEEESPHYIVKILEHNKTILNLNLRLNILLGTDDDSDIYVSDDDSDDDSDIYVSDDDSDDDSDICIEDEIIIATSRNVDAVRTIVSALHGNNTLQRIDIYIGGLGDDDDDVIRHMNTHYKKFPQDPRVHYYSYASKFR